MNVGLFCEGMSVQLHSLSNPTMNGEIGVVCRYVKKGKQKGRYGVVLNSSKKKVAVRPENLRVAPAIPQKGIGENNENEPIGRQRKIHVYIYLLFYRTCMFNQLSTAYPIGANALQRTYTT